VVSGHDHHVGSLRENLGDETVEAFQGLHLGVEIPVLARLVGVLVVEKEEIVGVPVLAQRRHLVGKAGADLPLTLDGRPLSRGVIELKEPSQTFVFTDVAERPTPSINRGFSAPIKLSLPIEAEDLRFLAAHDSDPFNRWQAVQTLAQQMLVPGAVVLLRTPIVASVIGEGGSGGALGIGVADRVLMLENAYYSVISPEGCAAILWKHRSHAPEAAEALKLTAPDLKELQLIDEVIPEPLGGAHQDHALAALNLRSALLAHLDQLTKKPIDTLLNERYEKFRRMGKVFEGNDSN